MEIESIAQQYQITPCGLGSPTDHDLRNLLAESRQIAAAAEWAEKYLRPQERVNRRWASVGLKWLYEKDPAGGRDKTFLSNGAMIVALILAGLTVEPDGDKGEFSRYVYANVSQRSIRRLTDFIYGYQSWHNRDATIRLIKHQIHQEVRGKSWRCGGCYTWFDIESMDVGAYVAVHRPGDRHPPKIVSICDFCVTTKTQESIFQSVFSYA